jgi:hypothetical protein
VTHAIDRLVLREIADHADWKTFEAFPSVDTLAAATLLDRRRVMQCVTRLIDHGLLIDTGRKTGPTKRQRVYSLPVNGTSGAPLNGTPTSTITPPPNGTPDAP